MAIDQVLCNGLGDPSLDLVEAGQQRLTNYADDALEGALQAIDNLEQFVVSPYAFNVDFSPNPAIFEVLRPAPPPVAPVTAFNPNAIAIPDAPTSDVGNVEFDSAPEFEGSAPVLVDRQTPAPFVGVLPEVPETPEEPVFPNAPDTTLPEKPALIDTAGLMPERIDLTRYDAPDLDELGDLPTRPELLPISVIPALREVLFEGQRPVLDFEPPPNTFSFTPEQYVSVLKGAIEGSILMMLEGGTGLPLAVVTALRDRAYSAEDRNAEKAIADALDEYASRGFSEPSGILNKRLSEVRQQSADRRSALSRDIYIKDEEIAVENLRFAVAQGVAYESALNQAFVDRMRVLLDAAKAAAQAGIDIYNARASLFNLQLEAYKTDASVYATRINAAVEELRGRIARTDAELRQNGQLIDLYNGLLNGMRIRVDINTGKVSQFEALNRAEGIRIDLFRAEVEAARAVGENNVQRVQLFSEQVRAILAGVQVYDSSIDAAIKLYDGRLRRFDLYKDQVQAFVATVGAKNVEWEGFTAATNADTAKLRQYEINSNIFSNRIQAWSNTNSSKIEMQRNRREAKALDINAFTARLDALGRVIQADSARVGADVSIFEGGIRRYEAEARVAGIVSDADERAWRATLEQNRIVAETAFRNVDLQLQQLQSNTAVSVEIKKSIAQFRSQLGAAAMSALNYSASVGSNYSQGRNCSTSISYSTDLTEANEP